MSEPSRESIEERITSEPTSGCWIWLGYVDRLGYGHVCSMGRNRPAHRVSYELHRGPIPDGLVIDHLCRVPGCVNPWHLEPVSQAENKLRGMSLGAQAWRQNACLRAGHPLTHRVGHPRRECVVCEKVTSRARRLQKRAAGLCGSCSRQAIPGMSQCATCKEMGRLRDVGRRR